MNAAYLDAIRKFEGFTPKANWDYAQFTNGYGTKAKYAGEVIDKVEADRRFAAEISEARAFVEQQVPGADEGTKAALTSLTFNAGRTWSKSGLGEAVRAGDLDAARALLLQYPKAGGETLPGLVTRRLAEATWIGSIEPGMMGAAGMAGAVPSPALGAVAAMSTMAQGQAVVPAGDGGPAATGATSANTVIAEANTGVAAAKRAQERELALMVLANAGEAEASGSAAMLDHWGSDRSSSIARDGLGDGASGMAGLLEQLQIIRSPAQPGVAPSTAMLLHDALSRLGRKDQEERT
jgi:lysozyme